MFGRRKRKSQEEEGLLVPHGLIWQATDEPREPTRSDPTLLKSAAEVVRTPSPQEKRPAISIVPPSPVSNTQSPTLTRADASPARLGAISPPIPWPSPETASVIRRIPPPAISPVVPSATVPSPAEPQAQPLPLPHYSPTTPQREVEVVDLATTAQAAESPRLREAMAQVLESLGERVRSIRAAFSGFGRQVRGIAPDTYQSINLRSQLHGLKLAEEKWVSRFSSWSWSAVVSFQHWWGSNLSRMARMKSAVGRFLSETSRSSGARSANWGRRIRNHKLRIRIVKPAGVQELIKRSRLAWAKREEAIRRRPRLWMSMTMAALSAMLTLGIISAVSHYAPGADASNQAVTNPAKHNSGVINPKIVAGPRASGMTTQASGSPRSVASRQAKTASTPENRTQRTTTRQAHRNEENDDYVAPDTYHYYGMNGKSR